ncbi:MAG TPA: tripartite tricarboxylate transporter substrate-binding protein [Roseomonas sp.]|jgi:tripartite-type tricarboxylate transporter receptor subunit TctC
MRRAFLKSLAVAGAMTRLAAPALAQTAGYPSRALRMIVPFAAGGAADVVARLMARGMGEALGQAVVVENRGGSGGVLGSEVAIQAAADGYTICFHSLSSAVLNAGLYRHLSFDVRQAFVPVSRVGVMPNVVLVPAASPARTLQELITILKANQGRSTYASSGSGTIVHLSAHLLLSLVGAEAQHVPYRGSGPALQDLAAGRVDFMVDTMAGVLGLVQGGQLRALAVTTRNRSAALPDVPTAAEAGLPDLETYNWHAVYVTRNTSAPVVARLEQAARDAVRNPAIRPRLEQVGVDPDGGSAAELEQFWDAQLALWIPIIRASGATAE